MLTCEVPQSGTPTTTLIPNHATDSLLPKFLKDLSYAPPYLVLDFETTNLGNGDPLSLENQLLCACWLFVAEDGSITRKEIRGGELSMRELVQDVERANFVVAHSAKFELQWLKRCGMDLHDILPYCTQVAQSVIDGNRRNRRSLNALSGSYFNEAKENLVNRLIRDWKVNPIEISENWLVRYCHRDVALTHRLFLAQMEILRRDNLLHIVHQRNLTCACLADIEDSGMFLDETRVREEYASTLKEQLQLKEELDTLCGHINFNSGPQLATLLYETLGFRQAQDRFGRKVLTDSGAASTSADTIQLLKPTNAKQRKFLDLYTRYRKATNLLTKNLDFFKRVVEEKDSLFKAELNQGRAATGRLASSGRKIEFEGLKKAKGVQFQNLPRQYKPLFRAREKGWLIAECDGAQIEFRVAAGMAGDEVALQEVRDLVDIHGITASFLTDNGEPTSRQDAKASTFKPLYGGMHGTPAVMKYVKFFNDKYKGISEMQRGWEAEVVSNKTLVTPYGIRFYWPGVRMRNDGTSSHKSEIYNYPVQGFATGEIIPVALVCMWHRLRGARVLLVNTVHDSIVAEIHPDEAGLYHEVVVHAMTLDVYSFLKDVYNVELGVDLGTGVKIAEYWGEGKETSYDVTPSGDIRVRTKGE